MVIAIFIHALAKSQDKNEFWNDLITFVHTLTLSFIILVDFNEISSHNEKHEGAKFNYRLHQMNDILSKLNCVELPRTRNHFSWRNKKSGDDNVLE